jgi:hypothetical protein
MRWFAIIFFDRGHFEPSGIPQNSHHDPVKFVSAFRAVLHGGTVH